jgi:hypothetical protein
MSVMYNFYYSQKQTSKPPLKSRPIATKTARDSVRMARAAGAVLGMIFVLAKRQLKDQLSMVSPVFFLDFPAMFD